MRFRRQKFLDADEALLILDMHAIVPSTESEKRLVERWRNGQVGHARKSTVIQMAQRHGVELKFPPPQEVT